MIIIAGYLSVDPAQRDRYVAEHQDLVRRARAFDGCVDLAITADPVRDDRVNNLEVWESEKVLEAWRAISASPVLDIAIVGGQMRRYDATDVGDPF